MATTTVHGYKVRIKKGAKTASPKIKHAVERLLGSGSKVIDSKACTIVVFKGSKAVQRCDGRTLAKNATSAQKKARANFAKAARKCHGKAKCMKSAI